MSGVISNNTDKQSGLIKTPVLGPDSGSSNPGTDENPSAVGARFVNTSSGELFVATTVTTDENVWKGQLGTDVAPPKYFGGRGVAVGGQDTSDIRLKEDIQLIGKSPSNINIYSFKYKGEPEYFEGVMAQEVPWVSTVGEDGFLRVDYSKIDVNFKKILRRK